MIAGIVLAALGAFILAMGVDDVGDLQVSAEEQRAVPPWVGWAAVVGGVALIGAGVGRRRTAQRSHDFREGTAPYSTGHYGALHARARDHRTSQLVAARGTTSPRSAR